jgi:peptidoglycan/xylan/chitin deacetylase (PgdA/CDA1 family)
MNKVEIKRSILNFSSMAKHFLPINSLINVSKENLILPFYHVVSNTKLEHIENLYKYRNEKEFIRDIDYLLRHFSPISLDDLIISVIEQTPLTKPSFLLSFDDGLRQIYDIAAPILKQKGIPAVMFVNPDFIGNKSLMFRYKASLLISKLNKIENSENLHAILSKNIEHFADNKSLINHIMGITWSNSNELDEIAEIIGVNIHNWLQDNKPYMDEQQIEELALQGFSIGSHSNNHPLFSELNFESQIAQATDSAVFIQKRYNQQYKVFAFPFTDESISLKFFHTVSSVEKGLTLTFGTAGLKKDSISTNLQRIPLENGKFSASSIIFYEYVYSILRRLLGRNTIKRKFY